MQKLKTSNELVHSTRKNLTKEEVEQIKKTKYKAIKDGKVIKK